MIVVERADACTKLRDGTHNGWAAGLVHFRRNEWTVERTITSEVFRNV